MRLGFFSVAMLLAIKTQGVMLERQQESEIFDLSQVGPESYSSYQPETLAQALAESKGSKKKCKTDKCPSLRNDMTHIAVTTANNQQVTIDMPMQETKRITVKQNMMVVEDKKMTDLPPVEDEKANPVVKPMGVAKTPVSVAKPVETKDSKKKNTGHASSSSSSSDSDSSSEDKTGPSKAPPVPKAPKNAAPEAKDGAISDSDDDQKNKKSGKKGGASSSSSSSSSGSSSSGSESGSESVMGDDIIGDAKSKAEAMQYAGKAFDDIDAMDGDKDGNIAISEVMQIVKADKHSKVDKNMVPEAEKLFKKIDEDGDGKVTKKEFEAFFGTLYERTKGAKGAAVKTKAQNESSSGSSDSSKDNVSGEDSEIGDDIIGDAKTKAEAIQFAGEVFDDQDALDGKKDGNVEISGVMELVKADKHSKIDKNMVPEAEKLLESIDKDGDGKVNKEEFKMYFGSLWDKTKGGVKAQPKAPNQSPSGKQDQSSDEETEQELSHIIGDAKSKSEAIQFAAEHFDDLDSKDGDKDGNVAADEIMKLVMSDKHNKVDKSLIKEAENLVKKIDEDGDGMVTKDEFTTVFGSIWERSRGQGKKN